MCSIKDKDIDSLNSDAIIKKNFLYKYEKSMQFFHSELTFLNINIYILEQIFNFPHKLFIGDSYDSIFLPFVVKNFFDMSLLIVTRLVTDSDKKTYNIIRFRDSIKDFIKPEYKQSFQDRLKKAGVDTEIEIEDILKRAKPLRNKRIAHVEQGKAELNMQGMLGYQVTFEELKKLRDKLNSLLEALSFNVDRLFLPISYSDKVQHPKGDNRTDIERILDSIARESSLFNMPEKHSQLWPHHRQKMTTKQIELLNNYRKKLKFPEV
ncbi:MAG: hypothetical protein PHX21_05735 [bacterium]|nr:hypothetical protein [bacterium]